MLASERLMYIIECVNRKNIINIKDISSDLGVSETTVRRDLEKLEEDGKLIRVHGGAKKIEKASFLSAYDEPSMDEKLYVNRIEKQSVCGKAASLVKDGESIFIDGGTTLEPMCEFLADKHLMIVTHSDLILRSPYLANSEVIMLGGRYIPKYNMCAGPNTVSLLQRFNFDHAFIGCAGISFERDAIYTIETETAAVKEAAMSMAANSYLLIDSSKVNVRGFCSFSRPSDFDAIICNSDDSLKEGELPENIMFA